MPEPVGPVLAGAIVATTDVPPVEPGRDPGPPEVFVPLVRVEAAQRRVKRLEIYRRPVEARAVSVADMVDLLRHAIAHEAADALGIELGEEWDDPDGLD
jgi:hypothetical protein